MFTHAVPAGARNLTKGPAPCHDNRGDLVTRETPQNLGVYIGVAQDCAECTTAQCVSPARYVHGPALPCAGACHGVWTTTPQCQPYSLGNVHPSPADCCHRHKGAQAHELQGPSCEPWPEHARHEQACHSRATDMPAVRQDRAEGRVPTESDACSPDCWLPCFPSRWQGRQSRGSGCRGQGQRTAPATDASQVSALVQLSLQGLTCCSGRSCGCDPKQG